MKSPCTLFAFILMVFTFTSCHSKHSAENKNTTIFFLEDSLVETNIYNTKELLDSSYSIAYHYHHDSLLMVIHSYTIRKYNPKNQLALEQEFDRDEEGKEYTLANQTLYEYDKKGRIIKETNLLGKTIFSIHGIEYNGFDSIAKEIYIVQKEPENDNTNMMVDMMHHAGPISYDTMEKTYNYDSSKKIIGSTRNSNIQKTSIDIGDNEKLNIKIHNTKKDYYIDSTWTKNNILIKQVYMEEYPVCTCRTCTYYNKRGDQIKMLKYRLMKE